MLDWVLSPFRGGHAVVPSFPPDPGGRCPAGPGLGSAGPFCSVEDFAAAGFSYLVLVSSEKVRSQDFCSVQDYQNN